MPTDITFHFLNRRAPDRPTGPNLIFVDCGGPNEGNTFDHHGMVNPTCTTAILHEREGFDRLVNTCQSIRVTGEPPTLVMFEVPDLDSLAAAYTVMQVLAGATDPPLSPSFVDYINIKTHGDPVGEDPEASVALFVKALKRLSANDTDAVMRTVEFMGAIEHGIRAGTFNLGWDSPRQILDSLSFGPELVAALSKDSQVIREMMRRAPKCLLSVPLQTNHLPQSHVWVDGIILDFSSLNQRPLGWKEYVRHDIRTSSRQLGFPWLAFRGPPETWPTFSINVDPKWSLSLRGLGAVLNAGEVADPVNPLRWYDGREHNYGYVDAPSAGSEQEPGDILYRILSTYDPLWREEITDGVELVTTLGRSRETTRLITTNWLRKSPCHWSMTAQSEAAEAKDAERSWRLADLLYSLSGDIWRFGLYAAYIPLTPCPVNILPTDTPHLYVTLALYLACHSVRANATSYPRTAALEAWAARFTWELEPGVHCAVSEIGVICLDQVGVGSHAGFASVRDDYFALIKQLEWTQSLSGPLRDKNRFEALSAFVARWKSR